MSSYGDDLFAKEIVGTTVNGTTLKATSKLVTLGVTGGPSESSNVTPATGVLGQLHFVYGMDGTDGSGGSGAAASTNGVYIHNGTQFVPIAQMNAGA